MLPLAVCVSGVNPEPLAIGWRYGQISVQVGTTLLLRSCPTAILSILCNRGQERGWASDLPRMIVPLVKLALLALEPCFFGRLATKRLSVNTVYWPSGLVRQAAAGKRHATTTLWPIVARSQARAEGCLQRCKRLDTGVQWSYIVAGKSNNRSELAHCELKWAIPERRRRSE